VFGGNDLSGAASRRRAAGRSRSRRSNPDPEHDLAAVLEQAEVVLTA
jgi:hypothetical protein